MDQDEKNHIQQHLPELIRITFCDEVLLSILKRREILHDTDIQAITQSPNLQKQAKKLYEIVITRVHGFEGLLCGLEETRQTGALKILHSLSKSNQPNKTSGEIQYERKDLLGKGSYVTKVYKGRFGRRQAAVKVVHTDYIAEDLAMQEIDFLLKCDWHENIVRYYGAEIKNDTILIALELCDFTLSAWIAAYSFRTKPSVELDILDQATTGVSHLHSLKIIHRDLKPENILLVKLPNGRMRVNLTDFGLSQTIPDAKTSFTFHSMVGVGSEGWVAPEVLSHFSKSKPGRLKMTKAMDVFSLGCITYYVVSGGVHPFGDDKIRRSVYILDGSLRFNLNHIIIPHVPSILLIKSMLAFDPGRRPSCTDVLWHPFFWPKERTLQFLIRAAGCSVRKERAFEMSVSTLESNKINMLGTCRNTWMESLCSQVRTYIEANIPVKSSIVSLLTTIGELAKNFESLPHELRATLGNSSSEMITYWKFRFPFLVDIVWFSFREALHDDSFREYYVSRYSFDLGDADKIVSWYWQTHGNKFSPKPFILIKDDVKDKSLCAPGPAIIILLGVIIVICYCYKRSVFK